MTANALRKVRLLMDMHDAGRLRRVPAPATSAGTHARRIQLVCNPADDAAFRAAADAALRAGVRTPDALARVLRDAYPRILVRARDLSHEEFDAWYVYRDGTWTRSSPSEGAA